MSDTFAYFAIGTTLANMQNLETVVVSGSANSLDAGPIALSGPLAERSLDSLLTRSGKVNSQLVFDDATDSERQALNAFLGFTPSIVSRELYVSALDEDQHYSPWLAVIDRPYLLKDYIPVNETYFRNGLVLPLNWCRLQSATKSANYTVTLGDHLLHADTSAGSVTFTLPLVASVAQNVVYSFVKDSAANSMILDGNGSETIDGAATKTATVLATRIDLVTADGLSWKSL